MAVTMKAELDIGRLRYLQDALSAAAFSRAWARALRKTGKWIQTHVAKAVSVQTRIPQRVLRERLYFFLRSRMTGKVWLGINAIEADRLGAPRQTRTGVTVRSHRFAGAWVMRSQRDLAGNGKVFRRVGRERVPYERVKVDWGDAGEAAFRAVAARAEERLLQILEQELRFEIIKVLR